MLIRFTVENFLSFNERVDFNMIASPDTKHPHHVVKDENDPESIGVLKTSLIYGANASGKSNLVKAMAFAQRLIVDGVDKNKNIPIARFKLDKDCSTKPSRFEFEFKSEGRQYAYGFVVDESTVYEEWLVEIGITLEDPIFTRQNSQEYSFNFQNDLFRTISSQEKSRLHYESKSTRKNLLFLANCKDRNIFFFKNIYQWFERELIVIFSQEKSPIIGIEKFFSLSYESKFQSNPETTSLRELHKKIIDFYLRRFDLGIAKIDVQEIDLDDCKEISNETKDKIREIFPYHENTNGFFFPGINGIINRKSKDLTITQIKIFKEDKSGNLVEFELSEESDGTRRILDLVPMLITLGIGGIIFVIDEIEKSLHPLLLQKFFEFFLKNYNLSSSSQLIATTHNAHLLDVKNIFRKDEIWFAEKDRYGQTSLYSLANTNVDDLDWEKGYINGRFGAIPFIDLKDITGLEWTQENNQDA